LNFSSCGLDAAAYAFERASGFVTLDIDFGDPLEMRKQLEKCFSDNVMLPFH